jgi:hypothetical protein
MSEMSPNLQESPKDAGERNWMPLIISAVVVVVAGIVLLLTIGGGKTGSTVAPINVALDPYAANLPLTGLKMSEAGNLAGGKETYIEGKIENTGNKTVSGVTVQVLFRSMAHEVVQNESDQLMLIRTRDPALDLYSIASSPIKPGESREFQLIFERVSQDWDGAYPELRILKVETK